jgi:putative DNA primase/helicase
MKSGRPPAAPRSRTQNAHPRYHADASAQAGAAVSVVRVANGDDAPPPHGNADALHGADWQCRLARSKDGAIKGTSGNAALILERDPAWRGVLGYDSRSEQPMLLRAPPYEGVTATVTPRPMKDSDDVHAAQWLDEHYNVSVTLQNVHAAINAVAELSPFDRVREYLDGLSWDGRPRLPAFATTYLGTVPSDYAAAVGTRWMISAVARTYEPGTKVDHVLVLEGPQGKGKSTALRVLAGDDHFGDDVPAIGTKDAQQYLGSLWIIELAEMDAATRAEASTLKRFLTTTVDRYRPPYGRRTIVHQRRCVFAGSVNLEEYLRDATGGRRFWPVACGEIDLAALRRDRDQLWSEAKHLYRAGEPWHLEEPGLIRAAGREQARRLESDPWEDAIADYLAVRSRTFVLTTQVLADALSLHLDRISKREANRVGAILRKLGWQYGESASRQRGWFRYAVQKDGSRT